MGKDNKRLKSLLLEAYRSKNKLQKVEEAGQEFLEIPDAEGETTFRLHQPGLGDDKKLDFPSHPELEEFADFLRSGIAIHEAKGAKRERDAEIQHIAVRQLKVLDPEVFKRECEAVLRAHGWMDSNVFLTDSLLQRLAGFPDVKSFAEAKARYGEKWDHYILRVAAFKFEKPFSRLWYAASMYSLYWLEDDNFLLGYLWCEYRFKILYESSNLRRAEIIRKNIESGKMGGQAQKKARRYAVLNALMDKELGNLKIPSPKDLRKAAQKLAKDYDTKTGDGLFDQNGEPLSVDWFDDWVSHYRQKIKSLNNR